MLIFTTNNRGICVYNSERLHCQTLLAYRWTHRTSTWGWTPPSQISPITAQRRPVYENLSFRYVTKVAESEQPVGARFYQWVGCRDHAGITCFHHSGSWQAQGGPAYICRDQRKRVFHNRGPLNPGDDRAPGEEGFNFVMTSIQCPEKTYKKTFILAQLNTSSGCPQMGSF